MNTELKIVEIIEHNWSDTSIVRDGKTVCSLSIYDEATEETQEALETVMDEDAKIIADALTTIQQCNLLPSELLKQNKEITDEREVLIKAFSDVTKEFEGREWIKEGRGPYTYDDDEYRKEVSYLFQSFEKIKSEMWLNIKSKTFEYKNQVEEPLLKQNKEMRELLENLKNEVDWTYNAWNGTKGAYYKYKIEQFLTPKN